MFENWKKEKIKENKNHTPTHTTPRLIHTHTPQNLKTLPKKKKKQEERKKKQEEEEEGRCLELAF